MTKARLFLAILLVFGTTRFVQAANDYGLKPGAVQLKSAGPLAFGPEGILFIGDPQEAVVYAIDPGDKNGTPAAAKYKIEGLQQKLADAIGSSPERVGVSDLVVNPASGNVYLLTATKEGKIALVKITPEEKVTPVPLDNVSYSVAVLPNPPADKVVGEGKRRKNLRAESITDLAFMDGKVIVAGLSGAEAPSTVLELGFPFVTADPGATIEFFHASHGRYEDYAPVRTFVPFNIGGEMSILAGFTCTPLVRFSLDDLAAGKKVRGTTLAELGNHNKPLDMISYQKNGEDFLLMSNSARGVMKINTKDLGRDKGLTESVKETAGQDYVTIGDLKDVVQMDRLNEKNAVVLMQAEGGPMTLLSVPLP
jgi:hypothetical protein